MTLGTGTWPHLWPIERSN